MKRKICLALAALCIPLFFSAAAVKSADITTAKACVVMEAASGRVLYQKNADERLPEASTTKIMTALVVAENADLAETVEVPKQAAGVEGSSIYLRAGEHLTVKELLYGLMLQSGNDCAVALALHVGKSIDGFAQMMNKKAAELGCKNTNFTNPHGLPDDNHYTSAGDLGLISCAAMNNAVVKEIVSTKRISISNEGYDYDRVIVNKNKILSKFDGANGVKTGYTKKAGRCFVGSAERDGMQLVAVLLNCGPMFEESMSVMDKFFAEYEMRDLTLQAEVPDFVPVEKGKQDFVKVQIEDRFLYPVKKDGSEDGRFSIDDDICDKLTAPVCKGQSVGQVKISFDNQLIFSSNIDTLSGVQKATVWDWLFPTEKKSNDKT